MPLDRSAFRAEDMIINKEKVKSQGKKKVHCDLDQKDYRGSRSARVLISFSYVASFMDELRI
jgi:hypothetical protein